MLAAVPHVLLTVATAPQPPAPRYTAFYPGEEWRDTRGLPIDAHGGGFLIDENTVFWYGEQRSGHPVPARGPPNLGCYDELVSRSELRLSSPQQILGPPAQLPTSVPSTTSTFYGFTQGVNAYASDGDLYNWRPLGLVLARAPCRMKRSAQVRTGRSVAAVLRVVPRRDSA